MGAFDFIAFKHGSGLLPLAHGRTAAMAALAADQHAPEAALHILDAYSAGPWLWAEQVNLTRAQAFVDATSAHDAA